MNIHDKTARLAGLLGAVFLLQSFFPITAQSVYKKGKSDAGDVIWSGGTQKVRKDRSTTGIDDAEYFNVTYKYWLPPSSNDWPYPSATLLFTGGTGGVDEFLETRNFLVELAKEVNAMVVHVEHRFFGSSVLNPGTRDDDYKSYTTLSLLSPEQVLNDFFVVVTMLRIDNQLAPTSPVVVFGVGDYGGLLASWMHMRSATDYKSLITGAVISSAAIRNYRGSSVPIDAYDHALGQVYSRAGCGDLGRFQRCFSALDGVAANSVDALSKLNTWFNLDDDHKLTANDQIGQLKRFLHAFFTRLALNDYPYSGRKVRFPGTSGQPMISLGARPIEGVCDLLKKDLEDIDEAYALRLSRMMKLVLGDATKLCILDTCPQRNEDIARTFIECTRVVPYRCARANDPAIDAFYDSCPLLPPDSNGGGNIPGPQSEQDRFIHQWSRYCLGKLAGVDGYDATKLELGYVCDQLGFDYADLKKVVFVNPQLSPSSAASVHFTDNDNAVFSYSLPKTASGEDLSQPNSCDADALVEERNQLVHILQCWTGVGGRTVKECTPSYIQRSPLSYDAPPNGTDCKAVTSGYPWQEYTPPPPTTETPPPTKAPPPHHTPKTTESTSTSTTSSPGEKIDPQPSGGASTRSGYTTHGVSLAITMLWALRLIMLVLHNE